MRIDGEAEAVLIHPDGQVEPLPGALGTPIAADYAPAVPRLRRRLPAAPPDRRARPRLLDEPWRGRRLDRQA